MKKFFHSLAFIFVTALIASAQKHKTQERLSEGILAAEQTIDTTFIWKHLRALADDSMMGRRPGTAGEKLTVAYLSKAFRDAGLTAPYQNSFLQPVHLLHTSSSGTISFNKDGKAFTVADSLFFIRGKENGDINLKNASLVFVGYGITAPEFKWDDYKGKNVAGKIVVLLRDEPQALISRSFGAKGSLTYHWSYFVKEETAKQHGAIGIIMLSSGKKAGPLTRRWEQTDATQLFDNKNNSKGFIAALYKTAGEQLATLSNATFEQWIKQAEKTDFTPVDLPVTTDIFIHTNAVSFTSYNVVGYIKGSDPNLNKECVAYSTHWDGYGINVPQRGDSIYNAATDNAGGISEMISIAGAMNALHKKPKRSIVFIASTAEESGMLGAEAYVRSPLFPLNKTVLAIGMDIFDPWGKVTKLVNEGYGYTSLDTLLQSMANKRNIPYQGPQETSVFAVSDQHQFAMRGIPAIFAELESESSVLSKKVTDSIQNISRVHTPFDRIFEQWDLTSAMEEARMLFEVGVIVGNAKDKPRWTVDNEFSRAAKNNK